MKKQLVSLILFASFAVNAQQKYTPLAEKMAETIMKTYPDSMVVMKYTSIIEGNEPTSEKNRPAKWNYEMGVVFSGFERLWHTTGDFRYFEYMRRILDQFIADDGKIRTYKFEEYNLDNIPTGRQLLTIHQTQNIKKYRDAADLLYKQLAWQPRTKANGYWHKLVYPTQMWLDGLYMAQPFKAEYALMTGKTEDFDDIGQHFMLMEEKARDAKTGLLYHGWDESKLQKWANPQTGQSPNFWSRAMGWYIMALVDVLDVFPENHPKHKELVAILNRLSEAILTYQDPATGVWWQVTDQGSRKGNYLESSGSAMFVYGLSKGIRLGFLPQKYLPAVKKGMEGLQQQFVEVDNKGVVHYTKAVGGAGLGGTPYRDGSYEYYVKEPYRTDDLKAIGPFMQACLEVDLLENQIGKNKNVVVDNYFNNEYRNNQKFHYLWTDRFDSGYSWWGGIFNDYGAKTKILSAEPSLSNLKSASVYIIVDPDTKKETKAPHFVSQKHIEILKNWVKAGGKLVLLANDTTNCEIPKFNELTKAFGISFTGKNRNMVKNDTYPQGEFKLSGKHEILGEAKKIFIKELVTLKVSPPAKPVLEEGGDVIMAVAKVGKGAVFVLGDPWIYNEYLNGRKLPADYENHKATKALSEWILK
jgi:unsaturated rhamnogalacturonyl hydrolase